MCDKLHSFFLEIMQFKILNYFYVFKKILFQNSELKENI